VIKCGFIISSSVKKRKKERKEEKKCGFIISSSAICPRMIFSLKHDIRISRKVSKSRLGDRQDIRLLSSQESLSARFLSPLCFVVFVPSTHRLILAPSFFPRCKFSTDVPAGAVFRVTQTWCKFSHHSTFHRRGTGTEHLRTRLVTLNCILSHRDRGRSSRERGLQACPSLVFSSGFY